MAEVRPGIYCPVTAAEVFERDVATLKAFGPDYNKVTLLRSVRRPGYEERGQKGKKNTAGNTGKLVQSLSRSKSRVLELALCNRWEWFGTFTLSPDKFDRYDLEAFVRSFPKFVRNLNKTPGRQIRYLLIPEQHKDGAWHMHGLFSGIPREMLRPFTAAENIPVKLYRDGYFDWPTYRKRFGFVSLGPVRDATATAFYVTKYVTKELFTASVGLNKHIFFCSQGLKRAEEILRAPIYGSFAPDYCNDHVAVKVFRDQQEALGLFLRRDGAQPVLFSDVNPDALHRDKQLEMAVAREFDAMAEEVVKFAELNEYDPDNPFEDDPFGVDTYMAGRI